MDDCIKNIFQRYTDGEIDNSTAEYLIGRELLNLSKAGRIKDYEQAVYCCTYFLRYRQYDSRKISGKDMLLFLRDFVLYLGRLRFPQLITNTVQNAGGDFGLYVTEDGFVDVIEEIPEYLKDNQATIYEVYELKESSSIKNRYSFGDDYLYKFTVFKQYRSIEQKVAVHSALELPDNYTLMISLPTGGGKSLVTQLLAASENRLTLVIVPTVSLAKDQWLQAKGCLTDENTKKNIFYYKGGADKSDIISAIRSKTARLIVTSPEAVIRSPSLNQALIDTAKNGYLHNVVIDEAHIVPDWGVHFRPDFQIFSVVLKEMQQSSGNRLRTYLLSATLSDDVVETLFSLFGSDGNNVQFRCDALRPEPRYVFKKFHDSAKRMDAVIEMIRMLPKPMIVYVISPETAENYCSMLREKGYQNIYAYTGKTNDYEREQLLEKWKNNEFDVMIATSAFGMGVDKANVRTIIHACVPETLSRFYQEVGRSGRDGLPSLSVLATLSSDESGDLSVAFNLINKSILTPQKLFIRLKSILHNKENFLDDDTVSADLNTVPSNFSEEEAKVAGMRNAYWNASTLLLLHRQGYIKIEHAEYNVQKKTYFFTFKVLDVNLINDETKLMKLLEADRAKEFKMRTSGYHKMSNIVNKPNAKCWGRRFVSLFPLARPICGCCPAHEGQSAVSEDKIRIRLKEEVDVKPNEPSSMLRRYMGPFNDMLVPVNSYADIDIDYIGEKARKLDISSVVYPDNVEPTKETGCMYLSHSEFLAVAEYAPWILRNGMIIILTGNLYIDNRIYEAANHNGIENYRKIWCCSPDTMILQKRKTIENFLNYRICNLEYV